MTPFSLHYIPQKECIHQLSGKAKASPLLKSGHLNLDNCKIGVYYDDYQSYINIMQVHSSATAALLHCCMVVALILEFDIILNSRSSALKKLFKNSARRLDLSFWNSKLFYSLMSHYLPIKVS